MGKDDWNHSWIERESIGRNRCFKNEKNYDPIKIADER